MSSSSHRPRIENNSALAAAPAYRKRGYHPFPLDDDTKYPPPDGITGWKGCDPTDRDYQRWERDGAWGNLGLVLDETVIGLDADLYYHPGEKMPDDLPPTVHSSSRDDGSGIYLYRVPKGTELAGKWNLGEIIQYFHRYVVAWPSVHPDTGQTYRWLDDDGNEVGIPDLDELPDLPATWLEKRQNSTHGDVYTDADEWMATLSEGEPDGSVRSCLETALAELAEGGGRHTAMRKATSQLVQLGADWHPGVYEALSTYIEEFTAQVDGERGRDATAEVDRAISGAIRNFGKPVGWYEEKRARLRSPEQEERDFWNARPNLTVIRDVARSRLLSEWAVLGCCLVNATMTVDHHVCLPPIVGVKAALNLFIGIVGDASDGKGTAMRLANELVPLPAGTGRWGVGSGEGIAHGFHKKDGSWVTHAVMLDVPEIETLCKIADRGASIVMPELRKAWSGEGLGQLNSDPAKRRNIPAMSYRLGLVAAIQRGKAENLLKDDGGGTPQRFVMVPATTADLDPYAESLPAEPLKLTPLTYRPPAIDGPGAAGLAAVIWPHALEVAGEIRNEMRVDRVRHNEHDPEAAPAHWMLCRLKVAAALAVLTSAEPDRITVEDWALAGQVMQMSDTALGWIRDYQASQIAERDKMYGRSAARREEAADAYHVERVAKVMVRRAEKLANKGKPCTKRDLDRAPQAKDRDYKDAALSLALEKGWLRLEDGEYRAD